jgi:hypothetical protein
LQIKELELVEHFGVVQPNWTAGGGLIAEGRVFTKPLTFRRPVAGASRLGCGAQVQVEASANTSPSPNNDAISRLLSSRRELWDEFEGLREAWPHADRTEVAMVGRQHPVHFPAFGHRRHGSVHEPKAKLFELRINFE